MHLILTGTTGFVGSGVLHHMTSTPAVTTVSVLARRPVRQAEGHDKVKVIIQKDFGSYPEELLEQLRGAEGCVWAQGISNFYLEEYQKITYDWPLAAARAFCKIPDNTKPFKFVYISSQGATTSPGIFTQHFGIIKGRGEASLLALTKDPEFKNLRPYSLRPGGVDPVHHLEIHEFLLERKGFQKVMEESLVSALRVTMKSMISPTRELGRVATDLASGDGEPLQGKGLEDEGRILRNVAIRRLAGI